MLSMDGFNFDVEHAKEVALRHKANLAVVNDRPSDFPGHTCTCG